MTMSMYIVYILYIYLYIYPALLGERYNCRLLPVATGLLNLYENHYQNWSESNMQPII